MAKAILELLELFSAGVCCQCWLIGQLIRYFLVHESCVF